MGELNLTLTDVFGNRCQGRFDIHLEHNTIKSATREVHDIIAKKTIKIPDLPSGIYKLCIDPSLYKSVGRFISVQEGERSKVDIILPVNPEKIAGIKAPQFSELPDDLQKILNDSEIESLPNMSGENLYEQIDDIRKAGLLNIYCKMKETVFQNERDSFSYVTSITRIRGDRIFARVTPELREEVKNSLSYQLPLFHEIKTLAHTPPVKYSKVGSFKTLESYGNLQFTFFRKNDSSDYMIDADIDDAQGMRHIFQCIRNIVGKTATHPFDIHEILVHHQKIDPGYQFMV